MEFKAIDAKRDGTVPVRVPAASVSAAEDRSPADFFWTVFQARWLISLITVSCVGLGILYFALATPIYRSDILIQVEEQTKSIAGLSEISALLSDKIPADTEMEILRSRWLVGTVVDQLNLETTASPVRFPVLGAIARRYHGKSLAPAFLGLDKYAWGGERIALQRLDTSDSLLNKSMTLVTGTGGAYELDDPKGLRILTGEVGKPASGGAGESHVEMYISDLVARPGTRFKVMKRSRLRVIEELQEKLSITERGRKTGVLVVALEGPNPSRVAAILDGVASTYLRQNVERKSAEAAKTLDFLETQLPTLKANLDAAEAALKGYQVQKGTLDLSREAQAMLERSVAIERSLSEAEMQRSDLRQRFTESHPALLSLNDKIEKLRGERAALNGKMRDLPGTELDSARLTRDVKVAGELYNLLLNKAQELRVVKSGTIGNVRILDRASVPDEAVSPKSAPVLLLSLVLGLTLGVAVAFVRKSLYAGLDDPEMVERVTGMSVYTTVPRSSKQASLDRARDKRGAQPLLAAVDPADPAVEALRSLRTALQFALLEGANKIVVVTGPTAEVGKSFITVNLAHVIAAEGRRVLVIDADLRRGRVHRFFGGERHPGLSDVLSGTDLLADSIRKSMQPNLDWLPTGRIPPNPSELLSSERFARILGELSVRYDLVLIDTAPILPVTDAALVGRHAAMTLLVLRAGAHPVREIISAVKRLAHNGVRTQGAVLNDASGAGARYSRYSYQYRYDSRA